MNKPWPSQSKPWKPKPAPLRLVTRRTELTHKCCRPGEGSRRHTLECGHEVTTKQSAGFPSRKRCVECARKVS